jgi:hypothetical protein
MWLTPPRAEKSAWGAPNVALGDDVLVDYAAELTAAGTEYCSFDGEPTFDWFQSIGSKLALHTFPVELVLPHGKH